MENKKNYTPIIITFGIIIFVVLVGAYYIGKNSNNQTQNNQIPVETSVQTPATQPSQTETQAPAQSSQSQCDTAAKKYFDEYWTKPTAGTTIEKSYKDYYNKNSKTCYVLVKFYYNWQLIYSDVHWNYFLYDIYNKDPYGGPNQLGSFSQNMSSTTGYNEITQCDVGAMKCYSLDGFMTFVSPYLSN